MKIPAKKLKNIGMLILFVVLILLFFFVVSGKIQAQQKATWEQTKSSWESAITKNKRIPLEWPTEYFGRFSPPLSFEQEQEVVLLWLLAVEGNYATHILPGIKIYLGLFDSEMIITTNKTETLELMLAGLSRIFATLDDQIRAHLKTNGAEGFFPDDLKEFEEERSTSQFHRIERISVYVSYPVPQTFHKNTYDLIKAKFKGVLNEEFLKKY